MTDSSHTPGAKLDWAKLAAMAADFTADERTAMADLAAELTAEDLEVAIEYDFALAEYEAVNRAIEAEGLAPVVLELAPATARVLDLLRATGAEPTAVGDRVDVWTVERCPVCTTGSLDIRHLGDPANGRVELNCDVCRYEVGVDPAEALGIGSDDLDDFAFVPPVEEPSADERAAAQVPVFDHPSQMVNDTARQMWARREAQNLLDKLTKTQGSVSQDELRERMKAGGSFILDRPTGVPALVGDGQKVLWAEGEGFLIGGPQGVGKTTLSGELLLGLLGKQKEVMGLSVKTVNRVLYLAMDRPQQIARAHGRLFGPEDRELLDDKLVVWPGPPLEDMAQNTDLLTQLAEAADADVVFVDSLKDAALGLSEDTVGAGWNRAQQKLLESGRNIVVLHHIKKAIEGDNPTINDMYGSTWITSGCGSVAMLNGKAGDPIVKFFHLKTPAEEIGPFTLYHDQPKGTIRIHESVDLVAMASCAEGVTARAAAILLYEEDKPSKSNVEKARRRLDKLVDEGELRSAGGEGKGTKTYFGV
ncbi:ATP-binding protein [Rhodococcus sp. CSLK01-03]|uniref:ATP-binding protein n=1 Tax=Rhodococcus indonesiensis TaxID=3055869 RepID=A0ABT7RLX1_9NOCA|nr:ATP-binding protein [Rhodococcus indonesiensis]MDM7488611.1 ATP-binding protein [Rhodococcus indonesiensis]